MRPASRLVYAITLLLWPAWFAVMVIGAALAGAVGMVVVAVGVAHPPTVNRFRHWAAGGVK